MGHRPTVATRPPLLAEWDTEANGGLDPAAVPLGSDRRVWWCCAVGHRWQARVDARARRGSRCPFCVGRRASPENNLAATHPEVAALWHPDRNGGLAPTALVAGSKRRVWWRCGKGHEWQSTVDVRTRRPQCPECEGWVLTPETSLAAVAPDLAAQWHPSANDLLTPAEVSPRSLRKVFWLCRPGGHTWSAAPRQRLVKGTGCPECAYAFPVRASDPLTVTHPELAAQWHISANGASSSAHVTYGSDRVVWWQCERGHEWQAQVAARTHGTGCPVCARWHFTTETSLAKTQPSLAAEWHPTLNGAATPGDVAAGSPRRPWWLCPRCGHEWRARISARSAGSGCPECAAQQARTRGRRVRHEPAETK